MISNHSNINVKQKKEYGKQYDHNIFYMLRIHTRL